MSRIQMCQTMLIVLPPVAVAVFLLSINQLDSAKIQNHLFRSYYTNICDEKRLILELLFLIFLIIYQFLYTSTSPSNPSKF